VSLSGARRAGIRINGARGQQGPRLPSGQMPGAARVLIGLGGDVLGSQHRGAARKSALPRSARSAHTAQARPAAERRRRGVTRAI
jgi:hypothetical protein